MPWDATEVVVIHLLVLGGSGTEQRAASLVQVGALQVKALVNQEVFLFGTERDRRLLGARLEDRFGVDATLRLSFGAYTLKRDIDRFIAGIKRVLRLFG